MPKLTAKILATKVKTEVAAFDMVSVQVPSENFVVRLRDIEGFMRSPADVNLIASVLRQDSVLFAFHIFNRTYRPVDP